MPKKLEGGPFGIFQHPFCRKTPKNERGPFGEFFSEVSQCRKNERRLFGHVQYCMLRGKPFWFSSLGQQGQFKIL